MDVIRHLFAFLYAINWKGGFLFPSRAEINDPPADGIYKTMIGEDELLAALTFIFVTVLKRMDKLGSHTGRKSGYLWGKIRGAIGAEDLMMAADHDSLKVAERYLRDASSIMQVNMVFQDPKQKLGQWRSPHCSGDETAARSAAPGAKWQKPLTELIVGFIEQCVGILPTDPRRRHPKYLCQEVEKWGAPVDPYMDLSLHLRDISQNRTRAIMNCMHTIQNLSHKKAKDEMEKKNKAARDKELTRVVDNFKGYLSMKGFSQSMIDEAGMDAYKEQVETGALPSSEAESENRKRAAEELAAHKKKKEKRTGVKTVEGRDGYSSMPAHNKLEFIAANADENVATYQNSDRQWLMRINPIAKCYTTCCGKDAEKFLAMHGKQSKKKAWSFSIDGLRKSGMEGCESCRGGDENGDEN